MSSSLPYFSLHHLVYVTVQHTLYFRQFNRPSFGLFRSSPLIRLYESFGFCLIIMEFYTAISANFPTVALSKRKWQTFLPLFQFSPLQIWEHFAGAAAAGLWCGQGAVGRPGDVRG